MRRARITLRYRWQLWLFLLPYLAGLTLLVVLPALVGLPLAFTDLNAFRPPVFNGLDNLVEMANDTIYCKSVFNSGFYIAAAVPLRLLGALAMALLLLRGMRGIGEFRVHQLDAMNWSLGLRNSAGELSRIVAVNSFPHQRRSSMGSVMSVPASCRDLRGCVGSRQVDPERGTKRSCQGLQPRSSLGR